MATEGTRPIAVGLGQLVVSGEAGATIAAIGLGSCIGLVMHDRGADVGGMAHIMLPEAIGDSTPPGKFADSAVPALIAELEALGADRDRLKVKMAGGAQMFSAGSGSSSVLNVGARNGIATRAAVQAAGLRLLAADTGGSSGRTVELVVGRGEVMVRTVGGQPTAL
ncbi:MAG: chemotaxis protein CheD [Miltoncostaeaceae bacterium]